MVMLKMGFVCSKMTLDKVTPYIVPKRDVPDVKFERTAFQVYKLDSVEKTCYARFKSLKTFVYNLCNSGGVSSLLI